MIRKNPFPLVLINAAIRKVTTATRACFQSPSATKPAFVTAEPAKPRPITIIIGPIIIGGKSLSIHFVPAKRTLAATRTYTNPVRITPV